MSNRSMYLVSLFAFAATGSLTGCGAQTDVATDEASIGDDGKADGATGSSSFYVLRPDTRVCFFPGPSCGGFFIKRMNFQTTTCADGSVAGECYVAAADFAKTQLTTVERSAIAAQPMIVKGALTNQAFGKEMLGNLAVSEVWSGAVGTVPANGYSAVSGVLYRVRDNGVRCFAFPCPAYRQIKLNSTSARNIAGVDLSASGANEDLISDAFVSTTNPDGLLVDGSDTPVTGPAGSSVQLSAANFYAKVVHQAQAASGSN